jgi:hypothetical protein
MGKYCLLYFRFQFSVRENEHDNWSSIYIYYCSNGKKEIFYFEGSLYIHSDLCEYKELGEELNYTTATQKHYKTKFSIILNCSHYAPYLNDLGKVSYKLFPIEKRTITDFFNSRVEQTEDGGRLIEIQKKLDKITGKYISAEDILKIEAEFNIKFKTQ